MRHSPSNRPHTRKGSIYRTIFLLLLAVLLAALSQSGCGLALTSAGVSLTPSITTQPTNQTVVVGQTATFFVTISGASPLSYQWKKNGTAISGATSPSYTTPSETTSDSGAQFTVAVSNSAGNLTSSAATLTVNPAPGTPLQITTSPLPNGQVGVPFQGSVSGSGGVVPYTWTVVGPLPSGLSLNASTGAITGT